MNRRTIHRMTWPRWSRRTVLKTIGLGATMPLASGVAAAQQTRTVVDFDGVGPENLAVDADGNVYMTMDFSGEVRKLAAEDASRSGLGIDDTELVATLDPGTDGFITGIVEVDGTLYVALPSFDSGPDDHGVWEITRDGDGDASLLADLPLDRLPNGMLHDEGEDRLLVTDSFLGEILHVDLPDGEVETWLDDDLLDAKTFIGANGIAMDRDGDVFVANLDFGRVVRIPVEDDGSAGEPETFVEAPALVGADGLAFDQGRMLYVAVNGQDAVVRIPPSGIITPVADEDDGLDFPADVAFGRAGGTRGALFVANFAFDPATGQISGDPSLVRVHP